VVAEPGDGMVDRGLRLVAVLGLHMQS
jgi:hypothetical protein